jgi:AcrR family transcriptional regulator
MPPKTVFTKEQIIDTAFEIFREEGIENLSVRKLAARINCSTAPIYTSFENVDRIKEQLLEHALDILTEYTEKEYTSDAFLNIGLGLLEFARDYRTIYRKLFMESNKYQYILKRFNERNLIQMKKAEHLKLFEDADLASMLEKMSVYTHGLAAMLCAGMLEDERYEYFLKKLGEMGYCVIGAYAYTRGHIEAFEIEAKKGCVL